MFLSGMLNPMSLVSENVFGESDVMFPLPPAVKSKDISGSAPIETLQPAPGTNQPICANVTLLAV